MSTDTPPLHAGDKLTVPIKHGRDGLTLAHVTIDAIVPQCSASYHQPCMGKTKDRDTCLRCGKPITEPRWG